MGAYEDLIRETVEAVLEPGRPLTIAQIAEAVTPRVLLVAVPRAHPAVDFQMLEIVLRANPGLFVEVSPGTWARRSDGPEAGVPSRPKRPPFAGSAAAAAAPPEERSDLDAVGRPAIKEAISTAVTEMHQERAARRAQAS